MALTINTNITSLVTQSNLAKATSSLNKAIERMTTGYKINHASDNAAGYSIAKNWQIKLSSLDAAADNAAMGSDLLATLEDNYDLISSHLQRVRDLTEQAANGTYGSASKKAIQSEIMARLEEIDRISTNAEYNGIKLMKGAGSEIKLQVGTDASSNSQITLAASLTKGADVASLFAGGAVTAIADVAKACAGNDTAHTATSMLTNIDNVIKNVSERVTAIGAAQNRIDSAIESIGVQSENITSSLSTIRDADVASESSKYIQAQILQQAAATLLATANQAPSIALNLI